MRVRPRPDDHVAQAAQRRLEALVAELGGHPTPRARTDLEQVEEPADDGPEDDGPEDDGPEDDEDDGGEGREGEDPAGRHARRPLPSGQRAAAWAGDRAPAAVTGLRLGAPHLAVLGLVLVAGLVVAVWSYVQVIRGPDPAGEVVAPRASGGVELAPPPASPVPGAVASAAASPTAGSPSAPAEVVVDVEGRVRRPGLAVLPAGSRVADALEAAGGPRPGTDLQTLNLARLLVDGEQLLVGVDPPAGVAAGALTGPLPPAAPGPGTPGSTAGAPAAPLVDLNTADQMALETLPGVGPVTAAAILEWRTQHGAFTSVDELLEVSGIGDATLAEIAPHVTL